MEPSENISEFQNRIRNRQMFETILELAIGPANFLKSVFILFKPLVNFGKFQANTCFMVIRGVWVIHVIEELGFWVDYKLASRIRIDKRTEYWIREKES